jgi:hypothetical protein
MAGILDNKSRIMDVVVTEIGRRQIAGTVGGGQLKVEYASFTDGATFYQADVVSGSADATNRIFFEATSKKQDFITFETDDSGLLLGFEESPSMTIANSEIFVEDSAAAQSDFSAFTYITGSRFASLAKNIMTSSLDHFKDLRMIGSLDPDEPLNRRFLLDRNSINFKITNTSPWKFSTAIQKEGTVSDLDPMFIDKRLSNIMNFRFLPPITVGMDSKKPGPHQVQALLADLYRKRKWLGFYEPLGRLTPMTFSDLLEDLNGDLTPPSPSRQATRSFDLSSVYENGRNFEGLGDNASTQGPQIEIVEAGGGSDEALAAVGSVDRVSSRLYNASEGALRQLEGFFDLSDRSVGLRVLRNQEKDWDFSGDIAYTKAAWLKTESRKYLDQTAKIKPRRNPMSYPDSSTVPNVPRETVYFKESSSQNNIVMQMFEINNDRSTFKKLDVIDFGEVSVSYDENRPTKHVFFAGKIFFNELRIPSFVNLFTIIMD